MGKDLHKHTVDIIVRLLQCYTPPELTPVEISSPGLKASDSFGQVISIPTADCSVSPKPSNLPSFIEGFASAKVNTKVINECDCSMTEVHLNIFW